MGQNNRSRSKRSRTVVGQPSVSAYRVGVVAVGFVLAIATFGYRLVDLQLTPDPALAGPLGTRFHVADLDAARGEIVDRQGRSFALSLPSATVVADPRLIRAEEIPGAVAALSKILGTTPETIESRLSSDRHYVILDRQVDIEIGNAALALDLPGVWVDEEPRREHPNGACSGLALVGRVDSDQNGISGIELAYDDVLTGIAGVQRREASADGLATIPGGEYTVHAPEPGRDVALTLDRNAQYQTQEIMVAAVEAAQAELGVALITVPSTGEILAAVGVTRNSETGTAECTTTNLPATWTFEPGSILKPIIMAGVLQAQLTTPNEQLALPDRLAYPLSDGLTHTLKDYFPHTQATYSPTEIIVKSSNIGTITLAHRLGAANLEKNLRSFGFGQQTALQLPGEARGIFDTIDSDLELATVSIGQGIAVTPLQMIQAFNTLANGGVHRDPVLAVTNGRKAEPRRVVDQDVADQVIAMTRAVVDEGTGTQAAVPSFRVAGKTGTAWQVCGKSGYLCDDQSRHYTASFVGMVYNDLGAALSILVVIDNPRGASFYGGSVAAPAFAEIATSAVRQLRIPPVSDGATQGRVRALPAVARTEDGGSVEEVAGE